MAVTGNPDTCTFDNFCSDRTNRFIHRICATIAAKPTRAFNPLFFCGNTGTGKTHLAEAIIQDAFARQRVSSVYRTTGRQFFDNVILPSFEARNFEPHEKLLANADLFLFEDIEFLVGEYRNHSQMAFALLVEELVSGCRQVIMTATSPIKAFVTLKKFLKSRWLEGLSCRLTSPTLRTRIAIVNREAEKLGVALPEDTAVWIAKKFYYDMRRLKSSVAQLSARTKLQGGFDFSVESATEVLAFSTDFP